MCCCRIADERRDTLLPGWALNSKQRETLRRKRRRRTAFAITVENGKYIALNVS
jgi:hypothetical protein